MRDVAVAIVDYDGFPLDMISGERPSSVTSTGSAIDTPCGPAWGYNGTGHIRFAPTDLHNHSVTGEWTYFCKFMYSALGVYGTPVKHALTTSTNPYSQWAFELTGAGYLVSYLRTAAGSRTGTPNVNPALNVGADNTLAAVASVPGNIHGVYKNGVYQTGNTCPSLYYSTSNTTLELGTAFTGAVHVVFAWPRVLAADEIVWLHDDTWDVFEDSRKPFYVDMGAGSTQDASHVASGGATSGGSADSSREQVAQGSGGATAGGAASTSREVLSTGSGGASTGGAATSTKEAGHIASGGATSGGSAQSSKEASHVASGGGVSGGSADASTGAVQDAAHTASGGAVSGGAAAPSRESAAQGTGGASAGGSAASSREAVAAGQGGAASGGQASQAREAVATGSGGAVSGGAAVASSSTAAQQAVRPSVVRLRGAAMRAERVQGVAMRRVRLNPAVFRRHT